MEKYTTDMLVLSPKKLEEYGPAPHKKTELKKSKLLQNNPRQRYQEHVQAEAAKPEEKKRGRLGLLLLGEKMEELDYLHTGKEPVPMEQVDDHMLREEYHKQLT